MRKRDRSTMRPKRSSAVPTSDAEAKMSNAGVIITAITLWAAVIIGYALTRMAFAAELTAVLDSSTGART
jgi:hypothetical protein